MATCLFTLFVAWRTLKVGSLAIETDNNFTNFFCSFPSFRLFCLPSISFINSLHLDNLAYNFGFISSSSLSLAEVIVY